jgi:hypothetical protein
MEIFEKIKSVKNLIEKGRLAAAISFFKEIVDRLIEKEETKLLKDFSSDLIIISSKYHHNQRNFSSGITNDDSFDREYARLVSSMIHLVDEFEKYYKERLIKLGKEDFSRCLRQSERLLHSLQEQVKLFTNIKRAKERNLSINVFDVFSINEVKNLFTGLFEGFLDVTDAFRTINPEVEIIVVEPLIKIFGGILVELQALSRNLQLIPIRTLEVDRDFLINQYDRRLSSLVDIIRIIDVLRNQNRIPNNGDSEILILQVQAMETESKCITSSISSMFNYDDTNISDQR